eukprot:Hpha_TRINITY_DN17560_c0_g1::TRINITY_DN17560_c0_g1_i1::g.92483::m.92483
MKVVALLAACGLAVGEDTGFPTAALCAGGCVCCAKTGSAVTPQKCAEDSTATWPANEGACRMNSGCEWVPFDSSRCVPATRCANIAGDWTSYVTATDTFHEMCRITQVDCLATMACTTGTHQANVQHSTIAFTGGIAGALGHTGTIHVDGTISMTHGYTLVPNTAALLLGDLRVAIVVPIFAFLLMA